MCLLASSIAAGCTFCSQRRFKVIAAVKVPIAFREKLLAGKQEVAEVAEVAGDCSGELLRILSASFFQLRLLLLLDDLEAGLLDW